MGEAGMAAELGTNKPATRPPLELSVAIPQHELQGEGQGLDVWIIQEASLIPNQAESHNMSDISCLPQQGEQWPVSREGCLEDHRAGRMPARTNDPLSSPTTSPKTLFSHNFPKGLFWLFREKQSNRRRCSKNNKWTSSSKRSLWKLLWWIGWI